MSSMDGHDDPIPPALHRSGSSMGETLTWDQPGLAAPQSRRYPHILNQSACCIFTASAGIQDFDAAALDDTPTPTRFATTAVQSVVP